MANKKMMKGNMAIAEAALRGGMDIYAGYPITPSTEIAETLAKLLPKVGGTKAQQITVFRPVQP